jgi:hypothetical protein
VGPFLDLKGLAFCHSKIILKYIGIYPIAMAAAAFTMLGPRRLARAMAIINPGKGQVLCLFIIIPRKPASFIMSPVIAINGWLYM